MREIDTVSERIVPVEQKLAPGGMDQLPSQGSLQQGQAKQRVLPCGYRCSPSGGLPLRLYLSNPFADHRIVSVVGPSVEWQRQPPGRLVASGQENTVAAKIIEPEALWVDTAEKQPEGVFPQ